MKGKATHMRAEGQNKTGNHNHKLDHDFIYDFFDHHITVCC